MIRHRLTDEQWDLIGDLFTPPKRTGRPPRDRRTMMARYRDPRSFAWPVALGGDKGYRADWIDDYLIGLEITPVIPSKANEDRDAHPVAFDRQVIASNETDWASRACRDDRDRLRRKSLDNGNTFKDGEKRPPIFVRNPLDD